VNSGISQSPEGRRVFSTMTVLENLELGAFLRKDKTGIMQDIERVYGLFPRLADRRRQAAGTLSGGEQQMLALGRALMSRPNILLLDEPSMGLSPLLVMEIFDIIRTINESGTTILLVEQNARMALQIAHRAYVLETGSIVLSGTGAELMNSEEIKKAYLGG
jgi:branched-chain amino acid transport system ATP-binding protein